MKPLWVVVGPTASGKSELAVRLAERSGGEILCFDSTTVYSGLDIGTAKPDATERSRARHHLLDLVEPGAPFTLVDFLSHAEAVLADLRRRDVQPILAGGTFLYVRAFLEGYQVAAAPPDSTFRLWAEGQPLERLVAELLQRDPECQQRVDLQNPRRVIRALEVCRSGRLFSQAAGRSPRPDPLRKIGLTAPAEWLKSRIYGRCLAMLEAGWQQEVLDLVQKGLSDWLLSMRFIGYAEVMHSLSQPQEQSELAQAIADSTWRLVKKQRTWSRSEAEVEWFSADSERLWEELWEQLNHPTET